MARLPVPGADDGTWGDVLNGFLLESHNSTGTLKDGIVNQSQLSTSAQSALLNRANHTGTQAQSTITNLTTDLAGKAPTTHTHVATTDLTATGTKSSATYLRGDNTWATPTNTTYSVPTQAEAEAGTATTARAFSAQRVNQAIQALAPVKTADLATKANSADLTSHTSNTSNPHSVTKAQVGLGNVDNTSDASKPISTATQTALDTKAATSHTHAISDVTNLQTALDAKANTADLGGQVLLIDDAESLPPGTPANTIVVIKS